MLKLLGAILAVTSAAGSGAIAQTPSPPPMVRMPTTRAPQQPSERHVATYQQWSVSDLSDYTASYTRNDSGSLFGVLCGSNCVVYLNLQIQCNDREDYPAMINSPSGSVAVTLRCAVVDRRYVLTTPFTDFYDTVFEAGGEIGFAVPLQSGRFNISRFSLSGALEATVRSLSITMERRNQSQQGLRDFTI